MQFQTSTSAAGFEDRITLKIVSIASIGWDITLANAASITYSIRISLIGIHALVRTSLFDLNWTINWSGFFLDKDECAGKKGVDYHKDCHRCNNTVPGYTCECNAGFKLGSTTDGEATCTGRLLSLLLSNTCEWYLLTHFDVNYGQMVISITIHLGLSFHIQISCPN